MNRITLTAAIAVLLTFACPANVVQAQTGSHIKDNTVKTPETVVWFSEPREITEIRLLLQQGQKQEAVKKARGFLQKLRGVGGSEAQVRRYYGLSALCSALTMSGELDEAIESCNKAVQLYPNRWQALNNRGVAYYMSGKLELAEQDYNQALTTVQSSEPLTALVQHNMDLVQAKKSGDGQ